MKNNYNLQYFYNQIMQKSPVLYKYQFVVEFIQGGTMQDGVGGLYDFNLFNNNPALPDQNFTYYAQSASLPKFQIQKADVPYYGTAFRVPTVLTFDHDWSCRILIEQDMVMYEKLRAWQKMISSLEQSGGGIKTIPDISLRINMLNAQHTEFTRSYVLTGVWPTSIPEIPLKYENNVSTAMTIDAKFKYQYCYPDDDFSTNLDPLSYSQHLIR